jgi:hypothetical protein
VTDRTLEHPVDYVNLSSLVLPNIAQVVTGINCQVTLLCVFGEFDGTAYGGSKSTRMENFIHAERWNKVCTCEWTSRARTPSPSASLLHVSD